MEEVRRHREAERIAVVEGAVVALVAVADADSCQAWQLVSSRIAETAWIGHAAAAGVEEDISGTGSGSAGAKECAEAVDGSFHAGFAVEAEEDSAGPDQERLGVVVDSSELVEARSAVVEEEDSWRLGLEEVSRAELEGKWEEVARIVAVRLAKLDTRSTLTIVSQRILNEDGLPGPPEPGGAGQTQCQQV